MSPVYYTTTANPTPPATSPPKPPFQAWTYLLAPTSPHARIFALLLVLIPASLLLTSITLYRAHLLPIPPPTTHAHLSGPWAAEMALGSVRSSFILPPYPCLTHIYGVIDLLVRQYSSSHRFYGTSSSSLASPSPPAPCHFHTTSPSTSSSGP